MGSSVLMDFGQGQGQEIDDHGAWNGDQYASQQHAAIKIPSGLQQLSDGPVLGVESLPPIGKKKAADFEHDQVEKRNGQRVGDQCSEQSRKLAASKSHGQEQDRDALKRNDRQ